MKNIEGQMYIMPNGNIAPCPYTYDCFNYPAGCRGKSFCCGRSEHYERMPSEAVMKRLKALREGAEK